MLIIRHEPAKKRKRKERASEQKNRSPTLSVHFQAAGALPLLLLFGGYVIVVVVVVDSIFLGVKEFFIN